MNESGIKPLDELVLIEAEELTTEENVTASGIILTDDKNEELSHIKAVFIEAGSQAFKGIENKESVPNYGDIISVPRFKGYQIHGKDDKEYRIINGVDIVAILDGDWDIRSQL